MTPPLPLAAALALSLAGCGASASSAPWVRLVSVGSALAPQKPDDTVVRAQAMIDLACPAGVLVKSNTGKEGATIFRAEGCGHAMTYVPLDILGISTRAPGADSEERTVNVRRFVPVSSDATEASLEALDQHAVALALEERGGYVSLDERGGYVHTALRVGKNERRAIAEWVDFSRAASRDLGCPREAITLDVVSHSRAPSTYLAEGCGARGLFVKTSAGAFVITSRVAVAPVAPGP